MVSGSVTKGGDEKLSYGYHRMQVLAAFVNDFPYDLSYLDNLGILSALASPESILPLPTLIVGIMGLIINLMYRWLHNSSNNLNVKSAVSRVRGPVGIFRSHSGQPSRPIFRMAHVDPALTMVISFILFRGAYGVLKDSIMILLKEFLQDST